MAELGLDYIRHDVGGAFGGLDSDAYKAINPNQKVPTLVDGEVCIWESNAIIRYLTDAYGNDALPEKTPALRARSDMWIEWYQNTVNANFTNVFHHGVRLRPERRDPVLKQKSLEAVHQSFALFDRIVARQDFIAGDHLTLGDVPMAACLFRYYTMDIERPVWAGLDAYYARLTQIPNYRDNVMISYESLRSTH